MAKNDDVILLGKALKDLRGIKDVLQSQGDPFLANIMNRAIECIENQPAVAVVPLEEYDALNEKYKKLLETCGILDHALREYQQKYGE